MLEEFSRSADKKLVVIDPRRSETARIAATPLHRYVPCRVEPLPPPVF